MNIKYRSRIVSALAMMLCLIFFLQAPIAAASDLHYGTGADSDETLLPSDLFDAIFADSEASLTDGERAALDALSGAALTYNQNIPDSVIEREYDGSTGTLTVRVRKYEYKAVNGKTVSWIPTTVSLDGGEAKPLVEESNGSFACSFSELWYSDEILLDVDFFWQVEIPKETADTLLTLPYTVGKKALEQLTDFQTAADQYDKEAAAFAAYEEQAAAYERAKQAFDDYNAAMPIYLEKKAEYDAYLIKKAAYDKALAEYREYEKKKDAYDKAEAAYYEYDAFRQKYESVYDAYEPYLKGLEAALTRISILESMFLQDSHGWQFYSGVMGSAVNSVLQNSHMLVSQAGVKQAYVDNANSSTMALRPLLKEYAEIRKASYKTKLDRYRAEFDFYALHYEEIRDNITMLYQSIYAIYSYPAVSSVMNAKYPEKVPHFRQFLAQLYVLHCALDDTAKTLSPDPAWTVSPNYSHTVAELVEEKLLFPDGIVASPAGVTLPEQEVTLPDDNFPEPVEKPVKDFEDLEEPIAPTVVKNPGAEPTKAEDPGEPPKEVFPPKGDRPTAPALSDVQLLLVEELKANELRERTAQGQAKTLTLHQTISCKRYISNKKTVTFYDLNGTKLEQISVEYGAAATAPNMSRSPDERYLYTFLGWIPLGESENAELVNLQFITEDLSLYPSYKREDRKYKITWIVDTVQKVEYYLFGEAPSCPISTDRYGASVVYSFTGWSPAVTSVSADAIYTAQYEIVEGDYTVTWIVGNHTETVSYKKGMLPVCPIDTARPSDTHLHTFTGWNRPIKEVTHNVTYIAQYKSAPLGISDDGTVCHVIYTDTEIILDAKKPTVNFAVASELILSQKKTLKIVWDAFTVTLSHTQVKTLTDQYCVKMELTRSAGSHAESTLFRIRLLNSIGQEVCKGQKIPLSIAYTPQADLVTMVYVISGKTEKKVSVTRYAEGRADCSVTNGTQMLLRNEYKLQYFAENCDISALPATVPVGGTVNLAVNCTYGYEIASAKLVFADGTEKIITEKTFVMPAGAVSVTLDVKQIIYHVQFVVDGTVIYAEDRLFGESLTIPSDPTKAEDDTYTYTFAGWSPYVTRATGENRSPVYTATFTRTSKLLPSDVTQDEPKTFFSSPIVVLAVCLLAAVMVLVLLIIFRRQIKRLVLFLAAAIRKNNSAVSADDADLFDEEPQAMPTADAEVQDAESEAEEIEPKALEAGDAEEQEPSKKFADAVSDSEQKQDSEQ